MKGEVSIPNATTRDCLISAVEGEEEEMEEHEQMTLTTSEASHGLNAN